MKGILTAEDARLAVQHGVDGIIVSCHGGRELDTVPASVSKVVGIHVVNSIGNIGLSQMQVRRNVVVIIVVVFPRSSMLYCSSPTLLECHIPYSGATNGGKGVGGGGRPPSQCFSECSFRFVQIR